MSSAALIAYLNGHYIPLDQACVPVLDRGFLFGDAVYEVIPAYGGHLFRLDEHLCRLERSLSAIRMNDPLGARAWREICQSLLAHNGGGDQSVYLQVTRGSAPERDHAFPETVSPTVFIMTRPLGEVPRRLRETGAAAITVTDIRWTYCEIKATTLLANVLLRQQAADRGADEALLIRDGHVIEGAATNLFLVRDGILVTPPKGPHLLPGITRDLVLELARDAGIEARERAIPEAELGQAEELWLSSSTKEIVPVTRLDERPVGDGTPGPLWRRLDGLFQDYKATLRTNP